MSVHDCWIFGLKGLVFRLLQDIPFPKILFILQSFKLSVHDYGIFGLTGLVFW